MSKLTKTLQSAASRQLKLENLSPRSGATKSKSSTTMDVDDRHSSAPAAKKRAIMSETESGAESDTATVASMSNKPPHHPIFTAKKEPKIEASTTTSSSSTLIEEIRKKRLNLYESIAAFRFNKKRVRVLSDVMEIPEDSKGLVYWMSRDQRVQDNWALLYAQKLALKQSLPLHVCFCMVPTFLNATYRHYHFMLEGLKEVEQELNELNIPFFLLLGKASEQLPIFVRDNKIGAVICDFSPLRIGLTWVDELKKSLPPNVPFAQVDAHNIVPCWHASDKLEYAARTIRNKINNKLDEFLTEYPPLVPHPFTSSITRQYPIDWKQIDDHLKCDRSVKPVDWAKPGYTGGIQTLEDFIKTRLKQFDSDRNDPNKNALSNLSPWYHFGHVSVQRCILEIRKYGPKCSESVKAYMEEAIVRRELADNYCFYQTNYDTLEGAYEWARQTLQQHARDKRPALYTLDELENARTADRLWNASQIQMRVEGKMHGFMRMYWAKKILEWTESPKQALEYAIYLNDRYNLDGRDPNGYVGCMWSICGVHDQGWAERDVFGKIRYMNYEGCKRKFDIERYILKYQSKKNLL